MDSQQLARDQVANTHGKKYVGGGNRPIRLDDPEQVQGSLDVFAVRIRDDGTEADFKHLVRAAPGRLVFAADADALVLIAKGLPDTALRRLPRAVLAEAGLDEVAR